MTEKDVRGSYYLMYFGFCNCPDICPQSLYKITRALQRIRNLPEGKLIKLKTLFVSVDPDRDDSARIAKFLSHFDPSIIGLRGKTNDDPDLKEAMRNFKIYASKIKYE
jgi:protein SCO1/2